MRRTASGTGRWILHVLAGTEAEAEAWAALNNMRRNRWRYLEDVAELDTMAPADMYAPVGTYRDRPDYMLLAGLIRERELVAWTGRDAQLVGTPLPRTAP